MARLADLWLPRILRWMAGLLVRQGHSGLAVLFYRAGADTASYDHALALWREGRTDDAERTLRELLAAEPVHAEAHNLLGAIFLQRGQLDDADPLIRRALALRDDLAPAHNNLGNVLLARNERLAAADCYRAALSRNPDYAEALTNLGSVLISFGEYDEAERQCRRAVEVAPVFAGAHCNLGNALLSLGRGGEAVQCYRRALELQPGLPEALINLSLVMEDPGYLLGVVDYYEEQLRRRPGDYQPHLRIAQALQAQDRWDDGRERLLSALAIRPGAPDALLLLGHNDAHAGDAEAAIVHYRAVLAAGHDSAAHSGLVFNLLYLDGMSGAALRQEFAEWARCHAPPLPSSDGPAHGSVSPRPLRVGYVSRDFALHSVAFFLEPILANHDPGEVFSVCYSTLLQPDATTARFRELAGLWRDVSLMSLDDLERQVRDDGIDILVDLSGHTTGNRLPLFARRPAPVQVTYLGHPGTTGLSSIDYRIGDPVTDPPGMTERHYTEELLRLPGCFLTYRPPEFAPAPGAPPCLAKGHITFGSFNNALKISRAVIEAWARVLGAVPDAELLLKSHAFGTQPGRERVLGTFAELGVDRGRIRLVNWTPAGSDHLGLYGDVDVALDPFPYNGTTTTCEALWMGVPVVTLAGDRHSGRVGASLLSCLGLEEFVADSVEAYAGIATALAADRQRLTGLRSSLRDRLQASPLLDHAGFTRRLEAAYGQTWARYAAAKMNDEPAAGKPAEEIRLHIGGRQRKPGWKILDVQPGPHVDYVGDIRDLSAFATGSVSEIYASHVLEHLDQRSILGVLRELARILRRPGGRLMVSVPDLEILCRHFVDPALGPTARQHVMRMMFGGQVDAHDYHQIGLYGDYLIELLEQSGFRNVRRVASFGLFDDTSDYAPYGQRISLNLEATR